MDKFVKIGNGIVIHYISIDLQLHFFSIAFKEIALFSL